MKLLTVPVAALTVLAISHSESRAVTFDERWKSLFGVSEVITEAVSAKAELVQDKKLTKPKAHPRRHFARRGKAVRYRQWYKGGKKWHYVYKKRRRA